jgi:hypothetical protein
VPTPTSIALSVVPDAATSAQDVTVTVTPVPDGGTVRFAFDGADLGALHVSRLTGSITLGLFMPAGSHVLSATYSGDGTYSSSTTSTAFSLSQSPSSLWAWAPVRIGTGGKFSLGATLSSFSAPISGALVWFSAAGNELCRGTTDAAGNVNCTVDQGATDTLGLAINGDNATFGGDPTHLPVTAHSQAIQIGPGAGGDPSIQRDITVAAGTAPPTSSSRRAGQPPAVAQPTVSSNSTAAGDVRPTSISSPSPRPSSARNPKSGSGRKQQRPRQALSAGSNVHRVSAPTGVAGASMHTFTRSGSGDLSVILGVLGVGVAVIALFSRKGRRRSVTQDV